MTDAQHVYVPFQLAEGREIKDPFPYAGKLAAYSAEIKRVEPYYAIELSGVPSEEEAKTQFRKVVVAFYWLALNMRVGVLVHQDLQQVVLPSDPVQSAKNIFGENSDRRADVVIDGALPAIWPGQNQVVKCTGQPVGLIMSYSASNILRALDEGMRLSNPDAILNNVKLKLAIDLYCLSHFRASDFARFLVLWTALETAAPESSHPAPIVARIDKWIEEIRVLRNVDDPDQQHLESISGSLRYIKNQSHGVRTRDYVRTMLEFVNDPNAIELSRETGRLYGLRGDLTHSGKYDQLGDGLSRMDEIVCKALQAAMQKVGASQR